MRAYFAALIICLFAVSADARWVGPPQELADMTAVPGIGRLVCRVDKQEWRHVLF